MANSIAEVTETPHFAKYVVFRHEGIDNRAARCDSLFHGYNKKSYLRNVRRIVGSVQ